MKKTLYTCINLVVTLALLIILLTSMLGFVVLGVVEGSSMEPLLQTGDVVVIITLRGDPSINVNDIIVFAKSDGKGLVIHRVIKVLEICGRTYYVTKGDNNMLPDYQEFEGPGVPRERIVGKLVEVFNIPLKIPLIGYISILVRRLG